MTRLPDKERERERESQRSSLSFIDSMEHHQVISMVYRVIALTFFLMVYVVGLIGNGLLICKSLEKSSFITFQSRSARF